MKKFIFLVAFFGLCTSHVELFAQHYQSWVWFKRKKYYSVGASLNAMNYFGDITPKPSFTSADVRFTRPNFSLYVQRRLYPGLSTRVSFSYGRIAGSDASADPKSEHNQFRYVRNLSFRNDIFELSGTAMFDLIKNRGVFYQRPSKVIPYIITGVSLFYHNPKALAPDADQLGLPTERGGEWVALQPLGTEGQGREGFGKKYSRMQVALPLGMGFRYKLSSRWDLAFEVTYRYLITDYLDDVSGNYIDLGHFGTGPQENLARALHDRSREDGRDPGPDLYNQEIAAVAPYVSKVDGNVYPTFVGYGNDRYPDNIRGNSRDNDVLIVTGLHLSYIIPGQVRCPEPFKKKFRRHRL